MRKLVLIVLIGLSVTLSACGSSESGNNFLIRKENYFINEDDTVIIDYKTDENGILVELGIDRLLQVDEMIFYNTNIDYEYDLEGYDGDIFTTAGFQCTEYNDLMVPINIEVGNTRYIYNRAACSYIEVDRDNEPKLGEFVRKYNIEETIPVSKDVEITIVVFDESSIERFIEIQRLPHTMKMLGIYSIGINSDRDDFNSVLFNYYRDMAVFEQLILKHQDYTPAISEAQGIPTDINILEFDLNMEFEPLIDNFMLLYDVEQDGIVELFSEIGIGFEEVEGAINPDTTE
jgi:hypothetical protein